MIHAAMTDSLLLPTASLWRRELIRFARQPSRWISAVAMPAVFWLFLGSGLRDSFQMPGATSSVSYMEYAFPGTLTLIVLFVAVFSSISVIEDRQSGFLQAVLAAPIARSSMVLGIVLGGSTVALLPAMIFMLLTPLAGLKLTAGSLIAVTVILFVLSLGLGSLGFLFAWHVDSTQGFHGVMNLVLLPLWLLSGSLFPADGASTWLHWAISANPLTYGVSAVRHALYITTGAPGQEGPTFALSLGITVGFTLTMLLITAKIIGRKT